MDQCSWVVLVGLTFGLVGGHPEQLKNRIDNEATRFEPGHLELASYTQADDPRSRSFANGQESVEGQHLQQLCHPHGKDISGREGVIPAGMVLEMVHTLLISPPRADAHKSFGDYPTTPVPCSAFRFTHHSTSEKSQLYHQTVQTFSTIHKSKLGLHHFQMMPDADICGEEDVLPYALSQLVMLGEHFAEKYGGKLLPLSHHVPNGDLKIARSMAGQEYFQSTAAFVHGLLSEKQFMHVHFQKMESHVSRRLGSPCWCDQLCEVDHFVQKSYSSEHELFKDHETVFLERKRLYEELGISDYQSAKELIQGLIPWMCEHKSIPCDYTGNCLSVNNSHISQLFHEISNHNKYLSSNDLFQSYAVADTRTYFRELFSRFLRNASQLPFTVDVVDDFFLMKVLSVLGVSVKEHLSPGSRLVIEQYRKAASKGAAKFWKVLMNGEVITENIRPCMNESWQGVCGVDVVKMHVENLARKSVFGVCSFTKDEL